MGWILGFGTVLGGWVMLLVLGQERQRRIAALPPPPDSSVESPSNAS